jgi:hypothetical protein
MLKKFAIYSDFVGSQAISVGKATGLGIGRPEFDSRQRKQVFLIFTPSRQDLGPTHPPIQWVPGEFSPEMKHPGHEADHSPPFNVEVKNGANIPALPDTSSMVYCLIN